ncbi:MAG: protein kinase [Planctomycetes bacterium]|nr:protein kinase [Planctomycetota bacterium]
MQIGRYEVLAELGRGGMGAVYRCRDPQTGREVAIKVLLKGRDATPYQRTRFDREAGALAKVDRPNVVRLLDEGEEQGAPFLVLA